MSRRLIVAAIALLIAVDSGAAVTASVDRAAVDLNESFTLEIVVDSNSDTEPSVDVLDEDFYVGQSSQLSNTTIVNGQISRSRTWKYVLMARRTGDIVIPPIPVGSESSNPVTISVREPNDAPPGEADVFVASEVDFRETYVQAQILYTIKIYRAVATRQPSLREPQITGAEVLAELAGDERSYEAVLDGKAYNVIERVIAIYPQESGEINISPAVFEARVLRNGRITGRKIFESNAHTVNVLPQPAAPAEFANAPWLPARDVQLGEEWSRTPDEIEAGQPLTRRVQLSALGQLETQLPAVELPPVDGINLYPDRPELSRTIEPRGIRGMRQDQYAMIGVGEGEALLPALEVPWFDIDSQEWRVARLPERRIGILPSADAAVTDPEPVVEDVGTRTQQGAPTAGPEDGWWKRAAELLAALWLLTLIAWWWSARPAKRETGTAAAVPLHKQQAKHLKVARKAALAGDRNGVKTALLAWSGLQWPDNAPRSVGNLAERVSEPLAGELRRLSAASYGPHFGTWSGESLAQELRSFSVAPETAGDRDDVLPPLMPGVS